MNLFHPKIKWLIISGLIVITIVSIYFALQQDQSSKKSYNSNTATSSESSQTQTLQVGDYLLPVEVAQTQAEIVRGLSYRQSLPESQGMYFFLPNRQVASFWMYEMRFPIDIIWIDNGVIVGIENEAPIPSGEDIPTFASPTEVTNVLEVNAGFAKRQGFEVGDKVTLL